MHQLEKHTGMHLQSGFGNCFNYLMRYLYENKTVQRNTKQSFYYSTFFLLTCSASDVTASDKLEVGKTEIFLNNKCQIVYIQNSKQKNVIDAKLPYSDTCDFVRISNTNVIKIERYYDAWVVLIQSHKKINPEDDVRYGCDTQFKALIIRDDMNVFLNPKSNGGSGCPPIDRDRLAFITLADEYVNKN